MVVKLVNTAALCFCFLIYLGEKCNISASPYLDHMIDLNKLSTNVVKVDMPTTRQSLSAGCLAMNWHATNLSKTDRSFFCRCVQKDTQQLKIY